MKVNPLVSTHLFPMKPLKRYAKPFDATKAQPNTTDVMSGHYDGKELRPFEGRPGAMDFKKLPSRGIG